MRGAPRHGTLTALAAVVALALAGVGAGGGEGEGKGERAGEEPAPALEGEIEVEVERPGVCDGLDPRHCMLPFPSDRFTVADADTSTGRRVAFPEGAMPVNADGTPIDPAEWNRNDGFSPAPMILAHVPGLDPVGTDVPPVTDIGRSLSPESAVVLLDAETGRRVPAWAELDANAPSDDTRLLQIRPARNLVEGHRHVVALQHVIDASGEPVPPTDLFRAYRDRLDTGNRRLEARRPAMEEVFASLTDAGVGRDGLYLAWDFTVASTRSLSERMLHLRDDALRQLDGAAPDFTVDRVEDQGGARVVRGTFAAPSYLAGDGGPGSFLNNGSGRGGDNPRPKRNGTIDANFVCTVPSSASAADPARWALFGHGLLGTAEATVDVGSLGAAVNSGFCGTDWIGMSEGDLAFLPDAIADFTKWRSVPDRLQQSFLHFILLGRLVLADDGFVTDPAFQDPSGEGVIDRDDLFFVGGSQGGILGGALSAVATDWTRAFLAVPGINYSLLLDRSSQFAPFEPLLETAYPDEVEQVLSIALIQMLWDRGENSGYARHLTRDPYRDTPAKDVLLFEAFGDFQVANVSTEVLARTIGAKVRAPALAPGRSNAVEPFFGIDPVPSYPFDGSALVVWDYGTPPPPVENMARSDGADPHGLILSTIPAVLMASDYLMTDGALNDPCAGAPCRS